MEATSSHGARNLMIIVGYRGDHDSSGDRHDGDATPGSATCGPLEAPAVTPAVPQFRVLLVLPLVVLALLVATMTVNPPVA